MRIAEQVAAASGVRLLAGDRARLAQRETSDQEAYDLNLRGRYLLNQRTPDLPQAIAAFEGAVARDPAYATAWAGLASAYATLPFSPMAQMPSMEDILARADAAAQRALALDSTLASPHVALAQVLGIGLWRWPEAEAALKRAIALDPGYGPAHEIYSEILRLNLRLDSALTEAGRAVALEPTSGSSRAVRALALLALARYDEAEAEQRRAISLAPESPYMHVVLAQIAGARGDLAGMARALAETPGRQVAPALAAYAADTTRRADVVRAIAALQSPNPGLDANRKGWWYAAVGAPELAIAEFDKAVEYRTPSVLSGLRIPTVQRVLGPLPAYRELLTRVGLPLPPVP
jgi:serine/threonine-protein kinase